MNCDIQRIYPSDEVFSSPEFLKDKLLFNYIESARKYDSTLFYSDKKHVIICRKENNNSVWIWTDDEVCDDKDCAISIAQTIRNFDTANLEFYTKPTFAQLFSDMYALLSCDLDYQVKNEFSLGVYKYAGKVLELDKNITVHRYNKKLSHLLLQFYMDLKDEFNWSEEKVESNVSKYKKLDTFLLLKNGEVISVCVISDDITDSSSVRSVATKKEERNKGYGAMVTNFACINCRKKGEEKIMLYANNGNLSAVSTFKKAGFEQIGNIHLIKS